MTRLCLASWTARPDLLFELEPPHVLDSFYYLRKASDNTLKKMMSYIKSDKCKTFILDSGAFTYMESAKVSDKLIYDDFEQYIREYCDFINKWDIEHFVEMDIDLVVGIKKVEEYRKTIERLTGKPVIPVFHRERGEKYFHRMCEEYDYVAVGGLVGTTYARQHYHYLQWFIDVAHANNAKIHGLGFTSIEGLKKYNFDTVDSTSWLSGSRFASINVWNPITKKFDKYNKPRGKQTVKGFYRLADKYNGRAWIRFGKYLEKLHRGSVLEW
ncbi:MULTISPECIES: hypothetical protein [unclassified Staphylococcus]|uniref:hypothetical protein n=1 Tax=unclassified Staphylococcus TaxID=91994 RepID=UPI00122E35F5|nr:MULTISPECIES: hypothetical protein [unclassified Staphylococcus]KAA2278090.1 hypothetical protein F1592_00780 [Staphylococcus sp. GDX7P312P]KAA2281473.1 hypothetical protein F1591_03225 [Staphylococcus sp. GDX7P459A]